MADNLPKLKENTLKDHNDTATVNNFQESLAKKTYLECEPDMSFQFSSSPNFEDIRRIQSSFVNARNWSRYHTPRNLLLAMVGEVGELSELFMWKENVSEGLPDWSDAEKEHLGQELSDVFIYLLRLSERCHIDLPKAVLEKIVLNGKKYPVGETVEPSKKQME